MVGIMRLFILCLTLIFTMGTVVAVERHALVIGVDRYENLPADKQLQKAVNDARAIATALRDLNFEVDVAENVTRREFYRLWARFIAKLNPGDVAALYFSGHGVDLEGVYLMPRDVQALEDETGLRADAIPLRDLLSDLRARRLTVSFQIIDACRDNPFADTRGRNIGGTRGLSRPENARGNFIMYSADERQQALDRLGDDDANPNSIYTRSLLPLLSKDSGLSLDEIAKGVRSSVLKLAQRAGREQFPAYYNALTEDWYPGVRLASAKPVETTVVAPSPLPPKPEPVDEAAIEWTGLDKNSEAMLETFLERHSDSQFARYAQARLAELKRTKTAALPPKPEPAPVPTVQDRSLTNPNSVFDGHWFSPVWQYSYILRNGLGTATKSNGNFRPGETIIRIQATGPNSFRGTQVYRDGSWHWIVGTLRSDGRIYISGDRNVSWYMQRVN